MKRLVLLIFFVIVAIGGSYLAARRYAVQRLESELFRPPAASDGQLASDSAAGLDVFTISVEDRTLQASYLDTRDTATIPVAVLVFHGNGTTIAGQIQIQRTLAAAGISSMTFDYSGFGESTGEATVDNVRRDAVAAYNAFAQRAGLTARKYVMGTSLGAAVMLDAFGLMESTIDGAIVIGTFASAVDLAVADGRLSPRLAPFVPKLYDNVAAAAGLDVPLLVVHSETDERFPFAAAERIAEAAGTGRLIRARGSHDDYLSTPTDWEPVLEFLEGANVGGR